MPRPVHANPAPQLPLLPVPQQIWPMPPQAEQTLPVAVAVHPRGAVHADDPVLTPASGSAPPPLPPLVEQQG
jgi:hypothetical protein